MRLTARSKGFSMLPRRSRARRRLGILLRVSVIVFAILLFWWGSIYYRIVTFAGVDAIGRDMRADAGIVLGASLWNDKPSPGLRERLNHSLQLYRAGVFSRIIVTGGLDAGGATITEAEGMRNYLMEQGVPESSVLMDKDSRNTYENLMNAKQIMSVRGWQTALIVTHRYHGARASDIARTIGLMSDVSVTDTKVMNVPYHQTRETFANVKWQLTKLGLSFE